MNPTDTTLAAYALNLYFGASLEDFEYENLIALAEKAGAKVTDRHRAMLKKRGDEADALAAQLYERETLRETLAKCRDQFRRYQRLHELKPGGQEKAKVNAEFADMCDLVLNG